MILPLRSHTEFNSYTNINIVNCKSPDRGSNQQNKSSKAINNQLSILNNLQSPYFQNKISKNGYKNSSQDRELWMKINHNAVYP